VARGIVRVPEGRKIFPQMTVLENLELGLTFAARSRTEGKLKKYMSSFYLRDRAEQMAGSLSGGEQQMLAIGRVS